MLLALTTLAQIWTAAPPLPAPTSNNAVAAWSAGTTTTVYSFLGLDSTKIWSGLTNRGFAWTVGEPTWREIEPVPGPGRLAGTAQTVGGLVYVFGGYTVAEDGSERSVPNVDVFDPRTGRWSSASPMPVPVDDAVSGVWRDSLIYLVSGWHDSDNVSHVQIYDPATDAWQQATPIPGRPVFGHTGGLAGNTIVYVDGARRSDGPVRYRPEFSSWRGEIDPQNPTQISWHAITKHPGPALYRAAAAAVGNDVIFAGGTNNPYNYNGIGYNGVPSQPSDAVFAFDVERRAWRALPALATPSMDHRGIVTADGRLVFVGGMVGVGVVARQVVTARIADVVAGGSGQ